MLYRSRKCISLFFAVLLLLAFISGVNSTAFAAGPLDATTDEIVSYLEDRFDEYFVSWRKWDKENSDGFPTYTCVVKQNRLSVRETSFSFHPRRVNNQIQYVFYCINVPESKLESMREEALALYARYKMYYVSEYDDEYLWGSMLKNGSLDAKDGMRPFVFIFDYDLSSFPTKGLKAIKSTAYKNSLRVAVEFFKTEILPVLYEISYVQFIE